MVERLASLALLRKTRAGDVLVVFGEGFQGDAEVKNVGALFPRSKWKRFELDREPAINACRDSGLRLLSLGVEVQRGRGIFRRWSEGVKILLLFVGKVGKINWIVGMAIVNRKPRLLDLL